MRYRKNAMIVAAQPESTEAGAEILKAGGNAVDAAMACALVQGVVDPLMCGIAGFGSCGIAMPAKGFHGYIDFHAPAPRAVRPDMWADLIESEARDGYGFILRGRVNDIGYQSICAPASLRAYRDAHREHGACRGSRSWSRRSPGRKGAGPCGPTWRTGGRTRDRWAARRARAPWRSHRPAGRSTAVPTAHPSAWAIAW
jgi:gamma-glutamyltranspeptidase